MKNGIAELLSNIRKFIHPAKERTLFSLGGRSYFENPASDMLAFFLNADAEHGFGTLFLRTFIKCMGLTNAKEMNYANIQVRREVQTNEGKRLDLVLESAEWVLLIENKIYHGQINPFEIYENYGRQLAGKKQLFLAVLSPSGTSVNARWRAVSYQDYCAALRNALAQAFFDQVYSKWVIFAREFILHFENELCQASSIMNDIEANYVEQNAEAIIKVKKMSADYRVYLLELLQQELNSYFADQEFHTKDDGWAVRCHSDHWGQSNIAFCSPGASSSAKTFYLTIYLVGINDAQRTFAQQEFSGMQHWTEGKWHAWKTQDEIANRAEAIKELCRLAEKISKVLPIVPEPPPPQEAEATL